MALRYMLLPLLLMSCLACPVGAPGETRLPEVQKTTAQAEVGEVEPLDEDNQRLWDGVIMRLRMYLPSWRPVKIRRVPDNPEWLGTVEWDPEVEGGLVMSIAASMRGHGMAEVLVHEWAHVLAWDAELAQTPHGSVWGVMYSRAFQVAWGTP